MQELKGLRGSVAVERMVELCNRGGNFEAQVEDFALTLKADVRRPFYHAREVAARLNVLTNAEVSAAFFDEGVLYVDGVRCKGEEVLAV